MPAKGMTALDLQSVIQTRLTDALNGEEASAFQEARLKALKYYRGDKLGNEEKGRSQVVSRDTAEAIDSLMPGLMKIFVGSDKTGVFEPTKEEEQDAANQATDYVNWIWLTKNNGAIKFHTWAKDALQFRLGVIKVWWQKEEKRRREAYTGLTEEELSALDLDDDDEVKSVSEYEVMVPGEPGPDGAPTQQQVRLTDIVFYRMHEEGCVKVENVAPEDFFTDKRAICDDTLPFGGHRFQTTVSDLIEMGFDRDQVEALPAGTDDWTAEKTERHNTEDGVASDSSDIGTVDVAMRPVWVAEVYLRVDYDGDGVAEWRKVTVAGPKAQIEILTKGGKPDISEVDDHPFCTLTPYPTQHKLVGESIVDKISDIQDVNTALVRGALDNIYATNKPRPILGPKANVDDALNHDIGHPLRIEDGGTVNDQVGWLTVPFTAGNSLKIMEYFDQRKEMRTGVSRLTQGLDPNAINKTATGVNAITNFTQERQALVARIFAETGVKRLFKKILELVCKYQDKPRVIKLRGKWVEMNPTEWSEEMDFTPSVGIGTGNKDQMLVHLQTIYDIQREIVQFQGGLDGPLVTAPNVYSTLSKIVENAGLKSAELYFTDPQQVEQQPQPEQPDPDMIKMQEEMKLRQAELEQRGQLGQAELMLKAHQTDQELQLQREKAKAELALKAETMQGQQEMQRQAAAAKQQPNIMLGADGKAATIVDGTEKLAQGADALVQMMTAFVAAQAKRDEMQDKQMLALMQLVAAPKEVMRDPATGRATGVRTVLQ